MSKLTRLISRVGFERLRIEAIQRTGMWLRRQSPQGRNNRFAARQIHQFSSRLSTLHQNYCQIPVSVAFKTTIESWGAPLQNLTSIHGLLYFDMINQKVGDSTVLEF
ncbi:unnamed protein product [Parnassius mnemosyne]|uniref:Uncharacterized protein n=1 Tax=Parnassius mnemosyne TaxID=213953 RepID=A0AAV1KN82_9NEOP